MVSLTSMWITPLSSAWTLAFEVDRPGPTLLILVAGRFINLAIGIWMATQLLWIFAPHPAWLNWDFGSNALVLEFGLGWLVGLIVRWSKAPPVLPAGLIALLFWVAGTWLTADRGLLLPVTRLPTFGVASAFLLCTVLGLETRPAARAGVAATHRRSLVFDLSLASHHVGVLYAFCPAPETGPVYRDRAGRLW